MTRALLLLPLLAAAVNLQEAKVVTANSALSYWFYGGIALGLVTLAGLMSGLTVGMMGLSELELELKLTIGSAEEKTLARKLLPLVHHHHLLLVTLLLTNAVAAESLPIVLCEIVTEPVAMVVSTACILIVGEIIPMALCTGPDQMKIAARCSLVVRLIICLTFPISWPISLLLDMCFEEHKGAEDEEEKRLLGKAEALPSSELALSDVQLRLIHSAIRSRQETVSQRMLPLASIRCVQHSSLLDFATLQDLRKQGFSRVPVTREDQFIGILETKRLLAVRPSDSCTLESAGLPLEPFAVTSGKESLLDLLYLLRSKKTHIALICEDVCYMQQEDSFISSEFPVSRVQGLVTLESVLSHLTKISDFHDKAVGLMQQRPDRISRTAVSMKRGFGHFTFIAPAGLLFYGQTRSFRPASHSVSLSEHP